jgi:hypothetical protein
VKFTFTSALSRPVCACFVFTGRKMAQSAEGREPLDRRADFTSHYCCSAWNGKRNHVRCLLHFMFPLLPVVESGAVISPEVCKMAATSVRLPSKHQTPLKTLNRGNSFLRSHRAVNTGRFWRQKVFMFGVVRFMLKNTVQRRRRWADHVERKGRRRLHAWYLKEMRLRGKPTRRWMILKWILKKYGRITTGFIWLRERRVVGCLESCSMDLVSSYFVRVWNMISSSRAVHNT